MPTDTKQLTADEVYDRLCQIHQFSEVHDEEWRNQVARDLNQLIGRAVYEVETCDDECDKSLAAAVLRIVERVAEFDEISRKGKERE